MNWKLKGPTAWLVVVVATAVVLLVGLGRLPLIDRDEGEYTTVARQMIQRGDWIIPHVNDRPYYEKPAFYFWLQAGAFSRWGYNEAAARLPSAAAGLALLGLMIWYARRRGGPELAGPTAAMTLTSFMVVMMSRVALLDMVLTVFTTASIFFFFEGYTADRRGRAKSWYYAGWAALGASFLTKGPVGPVVILAALLPLALFNRNLGRTLWSVRIPEGLLIVALIAGPWYVAAFLREGEAFWRGFFLSQNVRRYTEVLLGHGPPVWYFIPILAGMVWPWFFFSLPALWRALTGGTWAQRQVGGRDAFEFMLAMWFLGNLVFFSAGATKLPHYILPAVPAVILLAAGWWRDLLAGDRPGAWTHRLTAGASALIGVIVAGALLAAPFVAPWAVKTARSEINPDSAEYAFGPSGFDLGAGPFVVGLGMIVAVAAALYFGPRRPKRALAAWAAAALVFVAGSTHLIAPRAFDYLQAPAKELALKADRIMEPGDRLAAFGLYKPTLWFYTGRHIERVRSDQIDLLEKTLSASDRVLILSRLTLLDDLESRPRFRVLDTAGGYVLGDNRGDGR
jgi:4-amino-4-deoxy-L-arabinose transferase-like glycosyltransferase